ncbi:FtsX-like permease family protein [Algoriphagus sp. C2-6-M1]|uniref:ABC transporter permease n=1 Tax=Algoriphagus persicinus TaxID=3108754 RepID=UPI002B3A231E|nr:FtsX-like permease family protein [Algoriphagus sp. C2-6-M1]MEB2782379.1 FtsX-like permease family protein [Algoriphagus sp. C2-6-M1]
MLKHHILLIYRSFKRFKSTFLINLIGLSTGLACVLLIFLWVNDELKVDKFHKNDSRLFQVMKNLDDAQGIHTGEHVPGLLARVLAEEMPEVELAVSVFPPAEHTFNGVLSLDETHMKARSKYADMDFFDVFSYPLLWGDKNLALSEPSSVVISESLAASLFQTADRAVGKTVAWKGERLEGQFMVSGVFASLPSNASIQFDILFNYDLLLESSPGLLEWGNSGPSTYLLLERGSDFSGFNDKIFNFVKSKQPESQITLFARHYSDRYLYNTYENGVLIGGRIEYVRLFSIIAAFILLIACINFMNLSTAKATGRIKEVGIKKAIGASRKTLVFQYLGESLAMVFLSFLVAITLVVLLLPLFNQITGKHLSMDLDWTSIFISLIILVFTGIAAGSYPALYLSGFNPVSVLKGKLQVSLSEVWVRKGLVVFQFVLSTVLIVAVVIISKQIELVQTKNLGFNRDNVIKFTAEGKAAESPETFLSEIKKLNGIIDASYMDGDLVGLHSGTIAVDWEGKAPDKVVDFELLGVGYDLIETLGIELAEGRSFEREFGSEDSKLIFNETAIENMGIADPIGKTVSLWGEEKQIVGVVKDFHFETLYEKVKPFFFRLLPKANNFLVKIKAGTEQETLVRLTEFYQEHNMGIPFEYRFLDEDFQKLYVSEMQVAALSRYFAGLAILISCLGLFGLAAFTAERKTKEIGIRKVMGASGWKIVRLLSGDFAKMVLLAILIALPLSFFIVQEWLANFAFKIDLEWWFFIGAGVLTLLIALLTVSFQSIKAAMMNPVKSLKSE